MKRTDTSARKLRLGRVALCAALTVACADAAQAQPADVAQKEQPRVVVETVKIPSQLPVELLGVTVWGEEHKFAEVTEGQVGVTVSFDAREGWLRQLVFKIRNRSDKAMLHVILSGTLGTGEEGDVPMMIETVHGQELDESALTGRAPRGARAQRLAPGEAAEVRWSADEYEQMVRFLTRKHPLAAYRKLRIDLREARFEDNTVWTMSGLHRIDPNDPRKWTRIDGPPTRPEPTTALKAGERIVEVDSRRSALPDDSDAIAVTGIRADGQNVVPGQPFPAGPDWLRSLTVRVRNNSAKPIASVSVSFSLPEASYRGGGIGFSLRHGARAAGGGDDAEAKPLPPGEEMELGFTGEEYEMNRSFAEKAGGVSEISRVIVGHASVVFADGTRAFVSDPLRAKKKAAPAGAK